MASSWESGTAIFHGRREAYEEHATGKNTALPQLEACLKSLREGDTLVVWRLDRLGRNLPDIITTFRMRVDKRAQVGPIAEGFQPSHHSATLF
jgi:DNA invertase Pin-like site-specific DNA recombinase